MAHRIRRACHAATRISGNQHSLLFSLRAFCEPSPAARPRLPTANRQQTTPCRSPRHFSVLKSSCPEPFVPTAVAKVCVHMYNITNSRFLSWNPTCPRNPAVPAPPPRATPTAPRARPARPRPIPIRIPPIRIPQPTSHQPTSPLPKHPVDQPAIVDNPKQTDLADLCSASTRETRSTRPPRAAIRNTSPDSNPPIDQQTSPAPTMDHGPLTMDHPNPGSPTPHAAARSHGHTRTHGL